MMADQRSSSEPLPPALAVAISIAFWLTLGLAAAMFAVLSLAPRLVENGRLRHRFHVNRMDEVQIGEEIQHLSNVVHALQHDPEFVRRVAASELATVAFRGQVVPVDDRLGYDARIPLRTEKTEPPPVPWFLPFVETLSTPSPSRTRWIIATIILSAAAFFVFHEAFFTGAVGSLCLSGLSTLAHRYRAVSSASRLTE